MKSYENIMEGLVEKKLVDLLPDLDVCGCDRCFNDIVAAALNLLPPKYVVTDKGYLYTKVETCYTQYEIDIMAAITKAAETVKKHPRHSEADVMEYEKQKANHPDKRKIGKY